MNHHIGYRLDAECGCSLTACENGLVLSERPAVHLRDCLVPKIERSYRGESNRDVRLGFSRMLEPRQAELPNEWKALIKGAVRDDPHMDCDEKKRFHRALGLGTPPLEDQRAWYAISVTLSRCLLVLRSQYMFWQTNTSIFVLPRPVSATRLYWPEEINADSKMCVR